MSILKRPGWGNYEVINEGRLHNDKLKDRIGKMFDRLSLGYSPNHIIDKISAVIRDQKGDKFDLNKISNEYIIDIANSDSITRGKFTPSLRPSFASQYQNTNDFTSDNTNSVSTPSPESDVSLNFSTPSTEINTTTLPIGIPSEDAEEADEDDQEEQSIGQQLPNFLKGISDDVLRDYEANWSKREKDQHDTLTHIKNELASRSGHTPEDAEDVDSCECGEDEQVFNKDIARDNYKRAQHPDDLKVRPTPKPNYESVKLSPQAVDKLLKENYIKQRQHKFRIEEKYGRI